MPSARPLIRIEGPHLLWILGLALCSCCKIWHLCGTGALSGFIYSPGGISAVCRGAGVFINLRRVDFRLESSYFVEKSKELVEDLIAIVTSFAGKIYGAGSHKGRKIVEAVESAVRDC